MSSEHENRITLAKELETAKTSKKRFQLLALVVGTILLVVLMIIYHQTTWDYAVLENVDITRKGSSREILFSYDVTSPGRIDFLYGNARLIDRASAQRDRHFTWTWQAQGKTRVSIRSRKHFWPTWNTVQFHFD